jgi:hypothetical protein
VRTRTIAIATLACTALVLAVAWLMKWEVGRAMALAPLIVVGAGAAAGVAVVLGRAALESFCAVRRPRLVFGLAALGVGIVIVLSLLGVQLPRE